jgi:hypothetical protein
MPSAGRGDIFGCRKDEETGFFAAGAPNFFAAVEIAARSDVRRSPAD